MNLMPAFAELPLRRPGAAMAAAGQGTVIGATNDGAPPGAPVTS